MRPREREPGQRIAGRGLAWPVEYPQLAVPRSLQVRALGRRRLGEQRVGFIEMLTQLSSGDRVLAQHGVATIFAERPRLGEVTCDPLGGVAIRRQLTLPPFAIFGRQRSEPSITPDRSEGSRARSTGEGRGRVDVAFGDEQLE